MNGYIQKEIVLIFGVINVKIEIYFYYSRYLKLMEFPEDVLRIIREFSKPLTRSDWKKGSLHAIAFTNSNITSIIKHNMKLTESMCYLEYFYPELRDNVTPIHKIIEKYGDCIFPINFYIYWRNCMSYKTYRLKYVFIPYVEEFVFEHW